MNFIKSLQAENNALKEQLSNVEAMVNEFRVLICSPKFCGVDTDGARKDWIATADVNQRLNELLDVARRY